MTKVCNTRIADTQILGETVRERLWTANTGRSAADVALSFVLDLLSSIHTRAETDCYAFQFRKNGNA